MFKKVEDVLEVAIRVERQGVNLYKRLYEKAASPKARDVFSFLAAEEERHAGSFRDLLEKVADYEPRYEYPGEYGEFIDSVASSLIEKAEKILQISKTEDEKGAIDAGLVLEKETILFYSELLDNFDLPDKEPLKKIIQDERVHWQRLENLKGKLNF